jgi:nitrogen-specific signal transduction histidine kinase
VSTGGLHELAFDQLDTPSLVIDDGCIVQAANGAAELLFNADRAAMVGSHLSSFWRSADHERLHQAAESLRRTPWSRLTIERVQMVIADRGSFVVDVVMTDLNVPDESRLLCEVRPTSQT